MAGPITLIRPSIAAGELSPSLFGRVDLTSFSIGASVLRNMVVNYRGPASSRAGTAFVCQSLTPASSSSLPPKIIKFQFNVNQSYILEFGQDSIGRSYMRVVANGAAVTEAPLNVTGVTQALPAVMSVPGSNFGNNDWVFVSNVGGMTQINSRTLIVQNAAANTFSVTDTFGNPINSLTYDAFTSGGTVARIYTNYDPPYALADLPYLKVTQSADVMTLCCVNQVTGTEYPPIDLARLAANNWRFTTTTFAAAISAPTGCTASASVTGSPATQYAYCVTAIDSTTGEESVASNVAYITNSVDIALTAGSHTISWAPVTGAVSYNIYQAPPSYDTAVPAGSVFAYIGQSFGTQFVNSNILADQVVTPPLHNNPFARGQVLSLTMTNQGSGYTQATVSASITSATGSGAVLAPVVVGGAVVAIIVLNAGQGYMAGDVVVITGQGTGSGAAATVPATPISTDMTGGGSLGPVTVSAGGSAYVSPTATVPAPGGGGTQATLFPPVVVGGVITAIYVDDPGSLYSATQTVTITDVAPAGTGATAILNVGPQTGTYPSVPAYFQSRRVYANTTNNPDTLFLSQSGAYQNMDSASPPIDSDAIVTTPWGVQVNGVQWLIPMPGGLIVATGANAWQITGAGGQGSALTPASQSAQPQESNGFSPTVPILKINYDLLDVQSLGYVIRDIQYNFYTNIYAGSDISVLSNHLFEGFQIEQWAWAQVPWKIIWATRNDGKFLSLTFDKEEKLQGWARHDTNGLVVGNEVATEPPVDAPYFVVKRYIRGYQQWAYYIERMDNRLWQGPEDPWCVDAGLALVQPAPSATLSAASADGPGTISGGYLATGGVSYTNPSAQIVDPLGLGSGGVVTFTQTGGVIDGFTIVDAGLGYSPSTQINIIDPTGAGATFVPFISQNVLFNASAPVFGNTLVGDVIRIGGGQATVTTVNNTSQVLAAIIVPILKTMPDDPYLLPVPAPVGSWTITTPVTAVTNLFHLEGMQVYGLADGSDIPLTTVQNGTVTLATPASSIKIGLPFIPQIQSMPIEISQMGSVQGKRKVMNGCTVRIEKSRGFQCGANQPVASMLDFQQEIPWKNMMDIEEVPRANLPAAALPLYTGDKYVNLDDDWNSWDGYTPSMGLVCAQQLTPNPLNILCFVPSVNIGDTDGGEK